MLVMAPDLVLLHFHASDAQRLVVQDVFAPGSEVAIHLRKAAAGMACIEKFTDKNRYYTQLKGCTDLCNYNGDKAGNWMNMVI